MKKNETNKVYVPVKEYILRLIRCGQLAEGKSIESEEALAKRFAVSRRSVRVALKELADWGYLNKIQGKGTFVTYSELRAGINRQRSYDLKIFVVLAEEKEHISDYFQDFISGIAYAASLKGCKLVYTAPLSDFKTAFKLYEKEGCSGIIWLKANFDLQPVVKEFDKLGIPQILINRKIEGISSICTDEDSAFEEIINFFSEIGHRKIVFINLGIQENIFKQRSFYFRKHTNLMRIAAEELLFQIPFGFDYFKKLDSVFSGTDAPTSIILGGHYILKCLLPWLTSRQIPEEFSVLCFNDSPEAVSFRTPITVYSDPRREIGKKALELLELSIYGKAIKGECQLVKGNLIARRSCAIPFYLRNNVESVISPPIFKGSNDYL
ncbi:MAG: GntR family transcriptional regulator [Victivallaceae bacterium]|nr:GntR family transcriptional regulator [Victivallaceae bacterium]